MLSWAKYVYDTKQFISMLSSKCVGVGAAKNSKNPHVLCGTVRDEKLLCAECADVQKLTENTLNTSSKNEYIPKQLQICPEFMTF